MMLYKLILRKEYDRIVELLKEGIDPIQIGKGSTIVGDNIIYIRCSKGRFVVKQNQYGFEILAILKRSDFKQMYNMTIHMNKNYRTRFNPQSYRK